MGDLPMAGISRSPCRMSVAFLAGSFASLECSATYLTTETRLMAQF